MYKTVTSKGLVKSEAYWQDTGHSWVPAVSGLATTLPMWLLELAVPVCSGAAFLLSGHNCLNMTRFGPSKAARIMRQVKACPQGFDRTVVTT
jgi:hypothetical protein